jgi:hypothetical protein
VSKLIALCYFVLSLFGCDIGGSTFVYRIQANGSETLYSKVVAQAGAARFDCVRSTSGQCHYSVFPSGCTLATNAGASSTSAKPCPSTPVERFAIANGDSRWIPGLQAFSVCVSADDGATGADCKVPESIAAQ